MTEVIHSMLEDGPTVCERCSGELRRVIYPSGIIFKGSGFYRTDSRGAAAGNGGTETAAAPASGDGSTTATKGTERKASGPTGSDSGASGSTKPTTSESG